jgi:hypothetical protein
MNDAGVLRTIAEPGVQTHFGSLFRFFESEIGGDTVAFLASYGDYSNDMLKYGIFVSVDGVLTHLISEGDSLFGSTIESFYLGQYQPSFKLDPNGTGNLAIGYHLSDGRRGIALATPVPEPTTFALVGALLLVAGSFRTTVQGAH